jgi:hypothetical protein
LNQQSKRTLHTEPDNLGRICFTDEWYDYRGKRGQVFFAVPAEHPITNDYKKINKEANTDDSAD